MGGKRSVQEKWKVGAKKALLQWVQSQIGKQINMEVRTYLFIFNIIMILMTHFVFYNIHFIYDFTKLFTINKDDNIHISLVKSTYFLWTYWLSGNNYRVPTLSKYSNDFYVRLMILDQAGGMEMPSLLLLTAFGQVQIYLYMKCYYI